MNSQSHFASRLAVCIVLLLAVAACQPEQQVASGTRAWIDAPRDRSVLRFAPYPVVAHGNSPTGLQQLDLLVNGASVGALNCENSAQLLVMCQGMWNPPSPGDYRLEARVVSVGSGTAVSLPVYVTIGEITPTPTPTRTETPRGAVSPVRRITITPTSTATRILIPPIVAPPLELTTVTPTPTPTRTITPPSPLPPPTGCTGTPSISSFTAFPSSISAGGSATLNWGAVSNADSVEITPGIGAVATPGSRVVSPFNTTTYTLVARCGSMTATRKATVNVPVPTPTRTRTKTLTPTLPPAQPPSAPGSLTIASKTCTGTKYEVKLQWSNVSSETGYRIFRGNTQIANMAANSTTYTDKPPGGGPYTYGVEAYNNAGSSSRTTVHESGCPR